MRAAWLVALVGASGCTTGVFFPGIAYEPVMSCSDWDEERPVDADADAAFRAAIDEVDIPVTWEGFRHGERIVDELDGVVHVRALEGEVRHVYRDVPEGMRVTVSPAPGSGGCLQGEVVVFDGEIEVGVDTDRGLATWVLPGTLQATVDAPDDLGVVATESDWVDLEEAPDVWRELGEEALSDEEDAEEIGMYARIDGRLSEGGVFGVDVTFRTPDVATSARLVDGTWGQ